MGHLKWLVIIMSSERVVLFRSFLTESNCFDQLTIASVSIIRIVWCNYIERIFILFLLWVKENVELAVVS